MKTSLNSSEVCYSMVLTWYGSWWYWMLINTNVAEKINKTLTFDKWNGALLNIPFTANKPDNINRCSWIFTAGSNEIKQCHKCYINTLKPFVALRNAQSVSITLLFSIGWANSSLYAFFLRVYISISIYLLSK